MFVFENKLVMCYFNLQICTMHTTQKSKKGAIILRSRFDFLPSEKYFSSKCIDFSLCGNHATTHIHIYLVWHYFPVFRVLRGTSKC